MSVCIVHVFVFQSQSRQDGAEVNVQRLVMERVRAADEKHEEKMREMKSQTIRLETELDNMKKVFVHLFIYLFIYLFICLFVYFILFLEMEGFLF